MSLVVMLLVVAVVLPLVALGLAIRDAATMRPTRDQLDRDYSAEGLRRRLWRRVVDFALIGGGVMAASVAGILAEYQ